MKKIFFFLFGLCFPLLVEASSITDLKVLNGTLSREFETNNNIYSVILNDDENYLKLDYELKDENAQVEILDNEYNEQLENIMKLNITNSDGTKEEYVFYLEKEESTPVFKDTSLLNTKTQKEIPYLIWYVVTGCLCLILLLFKVILLGFKKKKRKMIRIRK